MAGPESDPGQTGTERQTQCGHFALLYKMPAQGDRNTLGSARGTVTTAQAGLASQPS